MNCLKNVCPNVVVVGLPLHVVTHGHSLAVGAGFSTLLHKWFSFFRCHPYFTQLGCFLSLMFVMFVFFIFVCDGCVYVPFPRSP